RGDEVAGRSRVVAGNISAAVEATLAQILAALSGNRVAVFDSEGEDDQEQAEIETLAFQKMVIQQSNSFWWLAECIKGALLLRNGFAKVWIDIRKKVTRKSYENVEPEAIASLTNVPGAIVQITSYDQEAKTLETKQTTTTRFFRVKAVAQENFLYEALH